MIENQLGPALSRRTFILAGIGLGTAITGMLSDPQSSDLGLPPAPTIHHPAESAIDKEYNAADIEQFIQEGVQKSSETKQHEIISLPCGKIQVDRPIRCTIPEDANVSIEGNGLTTLQLDPSLSDIPKRWGSFAKRSILFLEDVEGKVEVAGINFQGGSKRAGKYGYIPPDSPWDAMLFIDGKGSGSKYDPAMDQACQRRGQATINHCTFFDSESEGILVQNLQTATVADCTGQNLDSLVTSAWCDSITVKKLQGENFTSDGIYITNAQYAQLKDSSIKTARQGYDIQSEIAQLTGCDAWDCGKAFELTCSETNQTISRIITLKNSNTSGCMEVYSIGPVQNLFVSNCLNDDVGNWNRLYKQGDFLHSSGLVDPQLLGSWGTPVVDYEAVNSHGQTIRLNKNIKFEDVKIRIGKYAPDYYCASEYPGIENSYA